jgi:NAD(P)-dependent dehydrogenase (short-subunit alcohol dehydrogenase family)
MGGGAGPVAYSSAKGAVINLTRAAARELAPDLIRVNAICPGAILTPLLHRGNSEAMEPRLREVQPWPEVGKPEHVASAALFLASDDARFITGDALVVDGGLMAASPTIRVATETANRLAGIRGVDHGSTGRPPEIRFS